jgi:type I restriction enzyme R subunit
MEGHGLFRRRRLPHWDLPGATYFVTTCLAGSIPAQGLLDLAGYRTRVAKMPRPKGIARKAWDSVCWKRVFARSDWWLDNHAAVRHFADPALAASVVEAIYYWAGRRYDVLAYVVMPSHLHWVFRPREEADGLGQVGNLPHMDEQVGNLLHEEGDGPPVGPSKTRPARERIMHTLKLRTALECNRLLHRFGAFWQDESYDHCVRDEDELERIIEYVEFNPVKAGLVTMPGQWRFSSAHDRAEFGILKGLPLLRPR